MFKKIKNLSAVWAAVFMVLMFVFAVALGNNNAVKDARALCEESFQGVAVLMEDRRGEAANLLVLAERYKAPSAEELSGIIEELKEISEKTPGEIAAENEALNEAAKAVETEIREILQVKDEKGDLKNLQAVMDDLQSEQNILNRLAQAYNETARQAQEIYQKLPLKFLLGAAPGVFE